MYFILQRERNNGRFLSMGMKASVYKQYDRLPQQCADDDYA